jgi:hypothetical protein
MHGFRNSIQGPILQLPGSSVRLDAQLDSLWAGVNIKFGGSKRKGPAGSTDSGAIDGPPPSTWSSPYIPTPPSSSGPYVPTAPSSSGPASAIPTENANEGTTLSTAASPRAMATPQSP